METKAGISALTVFADTGIAPEEAAQLAGHLQSELTCDPDTAAEADRSGRLILHLSQQGLALEGGGLSLQADLSSMLPRLKPANLQREMLVKAAKLKGRSAPLSALDATAGMGEDSLLLAAAGYRVTLYEYDPVIAALLRDALHRAAAIPELTDPVSRMTLVEGDSIAAMNALAKANEDTPDLILLDPMFPERTKSALVKKKFQLLHRLERPCANEEAMLQAAVAAGPARIVVKRPLKGPFLAGIRPSYSLSGKAIRYDCIVPPHRS